MNDQLPDYTPSDPAMAERWRRTLDTDVIASMPRWKPMPPKEENQDGRGRRKVRVEAVSTRRYLSKWGTRSGSEAMLPLFQMGRPVFPGPKGYPNTKTSMPILTCRSAEPILFME